MCNRLGKKKFFETYKKTRQQVKREDATALFRDTKYKLSSMYHMRMLQSTGFYRDKLFGHNNRQKSFYYPVHKLSKAVHFERIDAYWLRSFGRNVPIPSKEAVRKSQIALKNQYMEQ